MLYLRSKQTALRCREGTIKFDDNMFSCLSGEEVEALTCIVDKLIAHLNDDENASDVDFVPMMEMDERIQQRLEHPDEDIAEEIDQKILTDKMLRCLQTCLSERERQIISLRYGLGTGDPMPQREVAALLGISRSYVSRIEKNALEALRESLGGQ